MWIVALLVLAEPSRPTVTGIGAVAKVLFAEERGCGRRLRVVWVLFDVALTGQPCQ